MVFCIRAPLKEGENIRQCAIDSGVFDTNYRVFSDEKFLYIPITESKFRDCEIVDIDVPEREKRINDYREAVKIPEELIQFLPSSFDIVGDVGIIKIPEDLKDYSEEIGNALLKSNNCLRVVFHDAGVSGEFRIRTLERIAGTGDAETVHKENETQLQANPQKVYFNPRLQNERARVASLVKEGEIIIDMFAGVAPFGTVICKHSSPEAVYSIDLNPECEYYMRKNILINKIKNLIPLIGDQRTITKELPKADRIIMNLPQTQEEFLADACKCQKHGATIHMHKILERTDLEKFQNNLSSEIGRDGFSIKVKEIKELKNYSPTKSVYVFDIVCD